MITSVKNPIVRLARRVGQGREAGLTLAEGKRLVREALAAGIEIDHSLASDDELGAELSVRSRRHDDCTPEVLARASSLTTSPGVLAICRIPTWSDDDLLRGAHPFVALAAGVRDPGNLGALVRTAEAAGASGFVSLQDSADPFRDKAVRGSAGSVFRLPCRTTFDLSRLRLIGVDASAGETLWDADFGDAPQGFLFGSEAHGLPEEMRRRCETVVRIPTQPVVESLNVAVAAGIVLFELRRRLDAT